MRVFRPRLRELARLPHTDVFVALERYPAARRVGRGIRIFRVDGPVYYGNVRAVWCVVRGEGRRGGEVAV